MRWAAEPNKTFPKWPYHVLVLDPGEPLLPGFVEYWKRILTDGQPLPPASRTQLLVELGLGTADEKDWGYISAKFYNSVNNQSEGIGIYRMRCDHFDLPEVKNEAPQEFDRRELTRLLEQYRTFKRALSDPQAWSLLERLNATRPLVIKLGTANGWFELQPNQKEFGPLPQNDRLVLQGKEPIPENPFAALSKGIIDVPWMAIMQEFNAALIQYTPPHFKNIHCKLTEGLEQGQRALFYDIQCPEFPQEGTDTPNDRLHRAATRVWQHISKEQGSFPGVMVKVSAQPDGNWQYSFELLDSRALR